MRFCRSCHYFYRCQNRQSVTSRTLPVVLPDSRPVRPARPCGGGVLQPRAAEHDVLNRDPGHAPLVLVVARVSDAEAVACVDSRVMLDHDAAERGPR